LEELLRKFPAPTHIRMDNGPEFIALALQEWCVGSGAGTEYIPPAVPIRKVVRSGCLNCAPLCSLHQFAP
jgi:hypothetical protein